MTEAANSYAINALERRVTGLENAVTHSLERIEVLIRQQIQDLKNEHLGELRRSLDRVTEEVRADEARCMSDRKQIWEAVRDLELSDSRRTGSTSTWKGFGPFLAAAVGAATAAVGAWLTGRLH